jgi:hypothetical protein
MKFLVDDEKKALVGGAAESTAKIKNNVKAEADQPVHSEETSKATVAAEK